MPNVLNEFTGDGVTRSFNFAMQGGYLSREYVYFFTRPNDDLLTYTPYPDEDVTWISDYTVQTANPIPVGTTFVILRSTTLEPLVDFQNTSRITEKNLDTATWQSIHIAAETSDMVSRIQVVAQDAKLESERALAGAQSAALDALRASEAAVNASTAASSAQAAALQAGLDATAAAQSAAAASDTADAATATANAANATALAAQSTAGTALSTANSATSTANSASSAANTAVSTANSAASTAGTALTNANAAVATANSAAGTANTALTIANEAKDLVDEAVAGAVVSFNGRSGIVTPQTGDYTKAMVGLGNVDNTADVDKPLSTIMSNALGLKANIADVNASLALKADQSAVTNALALKADTSALTNGLAANATADRNRANHTGTQAMSTISGLTAALANPTTVESINGGQLSAYRNVIVNGAMALNHEGPFSAKSSGFFYPVDCFTMAVNLPSLCTMSGNKTFVPAGTPGLHPGLITVFRLSASAWSASSWSGSVGTYAAIQTILEGNNIRRLLGRTCTLSFYVRGSKAGNACVAIRSGKSTKAYVVQFAIPASQQWHRVSVTLPGGVPTNWTNSDSDPLDGAGLQVSWTFASGTLYRTTTMNSWVNGNLLYGNSTANYISSAADWAELTGVQLEVGDTATEFEFEDYATTIHKVNRYVYLHDQCALTSAGHPAFGGGVTPISFPQRMARVPDITIVKTDGSGADTPQVLYASFASCGIGWAGQAGNGAWAAFSVFAKAYPS